MAAIERGLDFTAIRRMTVGQLVDFCVEYNNRQTQATEDEKRPQKRRATQADINAFFGG